MVYLRFIDFNPIESNVAATMAIAACPKNKSVFVRVCSADNDFSLIFVVPLK